jgi:hypothetical protein
MNDAKKGRYFLTKNSEQLKYANKFFKKCEGTVKKERDSAK